MIDLQVIFMTIQKMTGTGRGTPALLPAVSVCAAAAASYFLQQGGAPPPVPVPLPVPFPGGGVAVPAPVFGGPTVAAPAPLTLHWAWPHGEVVAASHVLFVPCAPLAGGAGAAAAAPTGLGGMVAIGGAQLSTPFVPPPIDGLEGS
jgi:hypothetical protein